MSDLIYELCSSNTNCFINNKPVVEGHHIDEIYTCLDCVENGLRKAERERIIKLLEEEKFILPEGIDEGTTLMPIQDAIALIKGRDK